MYASDRGRSLRCLQAIWIFIEQIQLVGREASLLRSTQHGAPA